MKYLHDDKLQQLTSEITDAKVGGQNGCRIINGRLEAYIMKRVGSDKKYAHELSEGSYKQILQKQHELNETYRKMFSKELLKSKSINNSEETEAVRDNNNGENNDGHQKDNIEKQQENGTNTTNPTGTRKRRSQSCDGILKKAAKHDIDIDVSKSDEQQGGETMGEEPELQHLQEQGSNSPQQRRMRAISFDVSESKVRAPTPIITNKSKKRTSSSDSLIDNNDNTSLQKQPTPLGDFNEMSTRRLLTDLILTLNASFPDYDFGNVKPNHFVKYSISEVTKNINDRLSEIELLKSSEQNNATSSASMDNTASTLLPSPLISKLYENSVNNNSNSGNNKNNGNITVTTITPPPPPPPTAGSSLSFLSNLWNAIDDVITLSECQCYSYVPTNDGPPGLDQDDDPMSFLTETLVSNNSTTTISPPTSRSVSIDETANNITNNGANNKNNRMIIDEDNNNNNNRTISSTSGTSSSSQQQQQQIITTNTPLWTLNYFFVNKHSKRILLFTCVETMRKMNANIVDDLGGYNSTDAMMNSYYGYADDDIIEEEKYIPDISGKSNFSEGDYQMII